MCDQNRTKMKTIEKCFVCGPLMVSSGDEDFRVSGRSRRGTLHLVRGEVPDWARGQDSSRGRPHGVWRNAAQYVLHGQDWRSSPTDTWSNTTGTSSWLRATYVRLGNREGYPDPGTVPTCSTLNPRCSTIFSGGNCTTTNNVYNNSEL